MILFSSQVIKPTTALFSTPAVIGLLLLTGCAVQQPMAKSAYVPVRKERPSTAKPASMFAAKIVSAAPATEAEPPVAPEPEPEPRIHAAAEPAPKKRGPLTPSEENEIDNQVMP